jgi:hypothetical protein
MVGKDPLEIIETECKMCGKPLKQERFVIQVCLDCFIKLDPVG